MTELKNLSDPASTSAQDIRRILVQQLESLRLAGVSHLPSGTGNDLFDFADPTEPQAQAGPASNIGSVKPDTVQPRTDQGTLPPASTVKESATGFEKGTNAPPLALPVAESAATTKSASAIEPRVDPPDFGPSLPLNARKSALEVLRTEIEQCTRCDELSSKRTQTVFGVGNPAPRLVFVGEGPGFHEDRVGEPFVGDAGEQLNKIIKACKLSRDEVFILNCVKCRPPGNRNPTPDELANCWGYAERQLEILRPEFIVCLGSVAAKTLLQTSQSLGRLRKQFHDYRGSRVLVTYHPAYLLRTPSAKRHVWEDMKMLMKEMGIDWTK